MCHVCYVQATKVYLVSMFNVCLAVAQTDNQEVALVAVKSMLDIIRVRIEAWLVHVTEGCATAVSIRIAPLVQLLTDQQECHGASGPTVPGMWRNGDMCGH